MIKENKEEDKQVPECCKPKKSKGFFQGILYGTIPHIGCIGFIIFSLLGVGVLSSVFKPLMLKSSFFYVMILISLVFATFSALLYLRGHGGIKRIGEHKGYLGILYGTTIAVSLILFFIVFPLAANFYASTGRVASETESIYIQVNIPCAGHAVLISDELKKVQGVDRVMFENPNKFRVYYDSSKTTSGAIMSISIFKQYPATILS